jgi:hypothetical protein
MENTLMVKTERDSSKVDRGCPVTCRIEGTHVELKVKSKRYLRYRNEVTQRPN